MNGGDLLDAGRVIAIAGQWARLSLPLAGLVALAPVPLRRRLTAQP